MCEGKATFCSRDFPIAQVSTDAAFACPLYLVVIVYLLLVAGRFGIPIELGGPDNRDRR